MPRAGLEGVTVRGGRRVPRIIEAIVGRGLVAVLLAGLPLALGASERPIAPPITRPVLPVRYAMPTVPKPDQSLVPDAKAERPMTTLEYAATLRAPLGLLRVSSSYGLRLHPLEKRERFHRGIDYIAARGTPIRAAQDGQITEMRGRPGYGYVVRMAHSHQFETVYGHMLKFMPGLKKGSVVRRGDILGFVGSTGRSTGPHLHFEVIANGRQVDPLQMNIAFAPDRLLSLK